MDEKRNELFVGILLVGIGLIFLVNQFVEIAFFENLGIFFMLGLGLVFLAWGVISRSDGLMIPGGILSGIGLGTVLVTTVESGSGDLGGAMFMGAFALGWVIITVFTAVFTDNTHWWPLIPAAIMALISAALLLDGPFMVLLEWVGKLWPLALIAGGIALLWGARKMHAGKEKGSEIPEADDFDIEKLKQDEA